VGVVPKLEAAAELGAKTAPPDAVALRLAASPERLARVRKLLECLRDDAAGGGAGGGGASGGGAAGAAGAGGAAGGGTAAAAAAAAAAGVGFVLGGLRGAGAARRRDAPFAEVYRLSGAASALAGGEASAAAGATLGALARGAGSPAPSGAAPIAFQLGGSTLEGLPVWLLTAGGEDAAVRCWDLERPRASHTVCGLLPGEVREAYEAAWLWPPPRQAAAAAAAQGADGEDAGEAEEDEAEEEEDDEDEEGGAGGDERRAASAAALAALREAAAAAGGADAGAHFAHRDAAPDGISACQRRRRRRGGGDSYAYGWQRAHPVRACLAQRLHDPARDELHAAGGGAKGVAANPTLAMKGAVPARSAHDAAVTAMAWLDLPTRLLITGAADGVVKVWR